jgi:hypothetical protein
MKTKYLEELMLWITQELKSMKHGEIHVILKVHDSRVALIEKMKIEKEKPVE